MKRILVGLMALCLAWTVQAQDIVLSNVLVTSINSVSVPNIKIDMVVAANTNDMTHTMVTAYYIDKDANGIPVKSGFMQFNRAQLKAFGGPFGQNVDLIQSYISEMTRAVVISVMSNQASRNVAMPQAKKTGKQKK